MSLVVAVIGASANRSKFGNKAVRAFRAQGYAVIPIHPRETWIEGLAAYPSVLDVPGDIDLASMYVPPDVGARVLEELAKKRVPEVWFNPGSESPDLVARARALGIEPVVACSILRIGEEPGEL